MGRSMTDRERTAPAVSADLRETMGQAIRSVNQCGLSHEGETRFCDDPIFLTDKDPYGQSILQDVCDCKRAADAALAAVSSAGYAIVPRQPSTFAIARAISTATTSGLITDGGQTWVYTQPTHNSMRAALVEYAEKGND